MQRFISRYSKRIKRLEDSRITTWCGQKSDTLGKIVMGLGVMMAIIGFPAQIWKNYSTESCGLSIVLIVTPIMICLVRIPYSIGKRVWHLIPADIILLLASIVLLGQYIYYGYLV